MRPGDIDDIDAMIAGVDEDRAAEVAAVVSEVLHYAEVGELGLTYKALWFAVRDRAGDLETFAMALALMVETGVIRIDQGRVIETPGMALLFRDAEMSARERWLRTN